MRALIQKVNRAKVIVGEKGVGEIGRGLLVFLGIGKEDDETKIEPLITKIIELRIFPNQDKKFDLSLIDVKGEALIVSQFTLYGDCLSGRRPDFFAAAEPEKAQRLYDLFVKKIKEKVNKVETGVFAAYMKVELENDGPVTLLIEK